MNICSIKFILAFFRTFFQIIPSNFSANWPVLYLSDELEKQFAEKMGAAHQIWFSMQRAFSRYFQSHQRKNKSANIAEGLWFYSIKIKHERIHPNCSGKIHRFQKSQCLRQTQSGRNRIHHPVCPRLFSNSAFFLRGLQLSKRVC